MHRGVAGFRPSVHFLEPVVLQALEHHVGFEGDQDIEPPLVGADEAGDLLVEQLVVLQAAKQRFLDRRFVAAAVGEDKAAAGHGVSLAGLKGAGGGQLTWRKIHCKSNLSCGKQGR